MQQVIIPLNEIVILAQPRKTFLAIESLANDIHDHGLLQPPTITKDKRLLYGERRVRACRLLNLETIPVLVCEEELTNDEILERQIAENVARDDLSWQERCLALLDLWRIKRQKAALEGWTWGVREAASLFKIAIGQVDYVLKVAKRLENELKEPEDKRKYWNYQSQAEAYRLGIMGEAEDLLNAQLAARAKSAVNSQPAVKQSTLSTTHADLDPITNIVEVIPNNSSLVEEARQKYESNPLNAASGVTFDDYWKERTAEIEKRKADNTIHLSNVLIQGDSIEFMNRPENEGRFYHIVTDIPYGIDLTHLNQNNTHGGMQDIDRVEGTHNVKENEDLHSKFFPAAFRCTKPNAFVVTYCDFMQWQRMYDLAITAGFAVQRWPGIWRKINQSVMNNCAGYNLTKDYEIIMFCRKKGSTLASKINTSIFEGSNTNAVKETGHPFAKPYEITSKIVQAISLPEQLILEPFAGGGSIALEILRSKRHVVAVEKETHHYNSMVENLKRMWYLKLNPNFVFK